MANYVSDYNGKFTSKELCVGKMIRWSKSKENLAQRVAKLQPNFDMEDARIWVIEHVLKQGWKR